MRSWSSLFDRARFVELPNTTSARGKIDASTAGFVDIVTAVTRKSGQLSRFAFNLFQEPKVFLIQ
jgi:hypothetical protein